MDGDTSTPQFTFAVGDYVARCTARGLPAGFDNCVRHARLFDRLEVAEPRARRTRISATLDWSHVTCASARSRVASRKSARAGSCFRVPFQLERAIEPRGERPPTSMLIPSVPNIRAGATGASSASRVDRHRGRLDLESLDRHRRLDPIELRVGLSKSPQCAEMRPNGAMRGVHGEIERGAAIPYQHDTLWREAWQERDVRSGAGFDRSGLHLEDAP